MAKVRVSTTVDEALLSRARQALNGANDAKILEQALEALLARHRTAEIDAAYAVYDTIPLSTPDAWGDLESWHHAASRS